MKGSAINIVSVNFEDTPHHMSMAPMSRYVFSRSHLSELCMDLASISEVENNYMGIPYSFFFNTLFLPLMPVQSNIFSHSQQLFTKLIVILMFYITKSNDNKKWNNTVRLQDLCFSTLIKYSLYFQKCILCKLLQRKKKFLADNFGQNLL